MYIGERQNIGPLAKSFRANGAQDYSPSEEFTYRSPEAIQAQLAMKPELYALTAVIADRCINRAVSQKSERPPFGLIEFNESTTDLSLSPTPINSVDQILERNDLITATSATLMRSVHEELEFLEKTTNPDDETRKAISTYKRYKTLVNFRKEFIYDKTTKDTTTFILHGAFNAADTMSGLIHLLPNVYEENNLPFDTQELIQTGKNSFPLVAEWAMQHLYQFQGTVEQLGNNIANVQGPLGLNPKDFILSETDNDRRLSVANVVYTRETDKKRLEEFHSGAFNAPVIAGCPAMVNFDGKSAVRKLWDWQLEIAEAIYNHKFAD
jgi:hypothetical protein